MKFSIITPSNNTSHILELQQSILAQTNADWEWIVLLNGDSVEPVKFSTDPRIRVFRDNTGNQGIGYLKNKAFSFGDGEILVEVDHDDLLTPDCLEKLALAFDLHPECGFVYSDDALWNPEGGAKPFNPDFGWTYRLYSHDGTICPAMDSFEPSAASMAFIWYMPDHVRAWRSEFYESIGGHDPMIDILDDQDILIRTYFRTKMFHIPEVLYIYRVCPHSASNVRSQEIQQKTVQLFYQNAYELVEIDAELNKLLKIDLGGGLDGRDGYITVDQAGANITCDLNEGIPLPDNSVGVLNASHIIEHLRDKQKTMSEIYRVLADGGWAMITVPSTDGRGAFQDPTHVSYWNQNSFDYYTDRNLARYIRNDSIRFQAFRCETGYENEWQKAKNVPVVFAWLRAIKSDKKRPHMVRI